MVGLPQLHPQQGDVLKDVTAHRRPDGSTAIRVNGRQVSLVLSDKSEVDLAAYYHPHEVFARMIEGDLDDTDLEILNVHAS